MATFEARLARDPDGSWIARAVAFPNCWSRGSTRDAAVAKLRDEIRYRIEYCPCTGVADDFVDVQVVGEPMKARAADVASGATAEVPAAPSTAWSAGRPAVATPLAGVAGCPAPRDAGPGAGGAATTGATHPGWKRWDDPPRRRA